MKPHSDSIVIWNELRNPDCTACELHRDAKTVCLLGDGPISCDGMVIGEAPGLREDDYRIPFSGKSGILLRRTLKEIGLDPRELFITNAVACRPPGNRTPTRTEVKTCSGLYLWKQIDRIKPKAVLILGNTALSAILGRKGGIIKLEGTAFKDPRHNGKEFTSDIIFVPSRHPSSVMRAEGTKEYDFIVQQFRENLLLFKRTLKPSEDNFKFITAETVPDFPEGPIYLDLETNGLNPFKPDARIHCMAIQSKDSDDTVWIWFKDEHIPKYRNLFTKHPIMAQRGTFEGTWIKQHIGVTPRMYHDTKLGSYLINENEQSGLKYQAIKHLNVEPWNEDIDFDNPNPKIIAPYNARDTKYGLELYRKRDLPHFRNFPKQARLMRYILLPAEEVFIDVICRGYHIDMEKAEERLEECKRKEEEFNGKLNEIAGREVNPGSPKQMVKLLYDDLGLECHVQTKKGSKSSSEAALIRLQGEHLAIDTILEWRKWKKYDSAYLTPWIRKGPTLHAGYDFTGTDTGRLSSSMVKDKRGEKKAGGTLHQCPRDYFIRNLITARHPDWCIVAADLSQAELRLIAHEAQEPTMMSIFNNGLLPEHVSEDHSCAQCDIHLATAQDLKRGEIDKETRKRAKAVNFGFVFGMWPPKFRRYAKEKFGLDLTKKESENYREKFFNKYDRVESWHRRVEAFVSSHGWVESVFGRRRHLPDARFDSGLEDWIRREAVRQGINSPIQSAASDLDLFIAALLVSRSLPWKIKIPQEKAFIVGAAHDSLIWECRRDFAKELRESIKWTVDNLPTKELFDFEFGVPIGMEVAAYDDCWEGKELVL